MAQVARAYDVNTRHDEDLAGLDIQHMPEGCATWPAFWTLSAQGPWPHGGEIDIVEGVNLQTANLASLHTTPSCMMPQQRTQAGSTVSTNCDASANFNQGCGTRSAMGTSYGSVFNTLGGGYYVMARTRDEGIKIWFWRRDDPTVPADVRGTYGAEAQKPLEFMFGGPPSITPDSSWGVPDAYFPVGDFCDYNSHFDAHMMVFDLTFCGDWAGGVYSDSGCGGDCVDLVDNHPDAFAAAYWEINSLRVYVPQ